MGGIPTGSRAYGHAYTTIIASQEVSQDSSLLVITQFQIRLHTAPRLAHKSDRRRNYARNSSRLVSIKTEPSLPKLGHIPLEAKESLAILDDEEALLGFQGLSFQGSMPRTRYWE